MAYLGGGMRSTEYCSSYYYVALIIIIIIIHTFVRRTLSASELNLRSQ